MLTRGLGLLVWYGNGRKAVGLRAGELVVVVGIAGDRTLTSDFQVRTRVPPCAGPASGMTGPSRAQAARFGDRQVPRGTRGRLAWLALIDRDDVNFSKLAGALR